MENFVRKTANLAEKKLLNKRSTPLVSTLGLIGVDGIKPSVYLRNGNDILRLLLLSGERPVMRAVTGVLKRNPEYNFLDIGAGAGGYTLLAASSLPEGQVVSFEPDPTTFADLQTNVSLNGFENVRAYQFALGSKRTDAVLYTDGASGWAPSIRPDPHLRGTMVTSIRTLDSTLVDNDLPIPDVVKIDVEGAEKEVLLGASGLLESGRVKHLFIEEHGAEKLALFDSTPEQVGQLLKAYGYHPSILLKRNVHSIKHYELV